MVNTDVLKGQWTEIKGKLKQKYGQLTDDDLKSFEGDVDQLAGMIQRKTGESREKIEHYLGEISQGTHSAASSAKESFQSGAQRMGESARQGYEQMTGHRSEDLPKEMSERAGQMSESMRHGYDETSRQIKEGYSQAEEMVKQRPMESVAVAFGVGVAAGLLVGMMGRSS